VDITAGRQCSGRRRQWWRGCKQSTRCTASRQTEWVCCVWNRAGHYIFILSFVLSSFFFSSPNLSRRRLDTYFHTWCGLSANLECMSEMCCARLTDEYRTQKITILSPSHNFVGLYLRSWGIYWQSEKNLLNTDTFSTCPRNMVNFGLLTAEICWRVWGTPANFNGFRVLAVLLHGTLLVGVSQTLRRWTEGASYIWQGDHHVGHWPTF